MQEKIMKEIRSAMLQKDASRLRALRSIKSQLDLLNSSGKEVTEEMQLTALQRMVKQRKESADIYKANNREDLYLVEIEDISVIEEFLPKQLSIDEIKQVVSEVITETGATSTREMGKVMGIASKKLSGKADNKVVSEIIKSLLS
jgi:hypothetical protein